MKHKLRNELIDLFNIKIKPKNHIEKMIHLHGGSKLYYDFRTSDDLDLNRNRLKTDFKIYDSKININYVQIKNFASRSNSDTEQISYQFEKELFKNWSFTFSQNRDLAGASFSSPFKSTFGVIFENDCSLFSFEVTRDKSYDIDIPSTTNYNFKVNLF